MQNVTTLTGQSPEAAHDEWREKQAKKAELVQELAVADAEEQLAYIRYLATGCTPDEAAAPGWSAKLAEHEEIVEAARAAA